MIIITIIVIVIVIVIVAFKRHFSNPREPSRARCSALSRVSAEVTFCHMI